MSDISKGDIVVVSDSFGSPPNCDLCQDGALMFVKSALDGRGTRCIVTALNHNCGSYIIASVGLERVKHYNDTLDWSFAWRHN